MKKLSDEMLSKLLSASCTVDGCCEAAHMGSYAVWSICFDALLDEYTPTQLLRALERIGAA